MSTDDLRTLLDAMQARCDAATEGPWDYQPWSTFTLPSGDYAESILMANASPDGEIARGLMDVDGRFTAAARQDQPRLIAAVEAVLKLHRRVGIYDKCDCTDEQKQAGHEDIYEVGLTCNRLYDICDECCRDDVYQREDCADYHEHAIDGGYCPTVTAIRAALVGDGDE